MYYYGGGTSCPSQTATYCPTTYSNGRSNYATVLVLFILLVIIIGSRINN